jgi:predicted ribosome quality control (RQC) complex YloA/Tae2 family protein
MPRKASGPPPPSDPEAGIWRGRPVAHRVVSPDGMTILVGRSAADNDALSFDLAAANDFWFHVTGASGTHVVVRNPEGLDRLPRETGRLAAALAAGHSKARRGGRTPVHVARCRDLRKPRGMAPGKVIVSRFRIVHASPIRVEELEKDSRS